MISVLLVDDEPVLLDIGRMFLEKSGGFKIGEAASGKEALNSLAKGNYDAIVSDFEMPEMDGLALLREVRSTWPDIPFILFTGRGREEVVIEALNSGADFYLQKGGDPKSQFTELAHKIRQAVITRKASSDLRESEETFRQFFEAAGDAILILDGDLIVDSNQRGLGLLGRNREEILEHSPVHFSSPIQPDDKDAASIIQENITQTLTGVSPVFEWRVQKPDGSTQDTEVSMSCITIHGRKLIHAIIRDISVRKKEEDARAINEIRLKSMLDLYAMRDNNLKELTDFVIESAIRITQSRYAYLAFVSEDESVLTMYSWSSRAKGEGGIQNKPLSYEVKRSGLLGEAVRERCAVITDSHEDASMKEKELPDGPIRMDRLLNIPIFDRDHIVLLAGVANKQDPYDDEDIYQLTLLMNGMWGIIRRKKTEEILQKKNVEITTAYEQLRAIEEDLIRTTHRQQLLSGLDRQDVMSNLEILTGLLNVDGIEKPLRNDPFELVKEAQKTVKKIRHLLASPLDYQSIGHQRSEWLNMEDLLRNASSLITQKDVAINNQMAGVFINVDPLFSRALYSLLDSVISSEQKAGTISVHAEEIQEFLKIIIRDDRTLLPESMVTRRYKEDRGYQTGMVSVLVRDILHSIGLQIHETVNSESGVQYEILVPLSLLKAL